MTLRDDALYYRELGWVTTPLINDDQGYPKKPFVDGWQREVLSDVPNLPWEEAIGLGVVLGPQSGNLAVLDLDDVELAEAAAAVCSANYFVRTARGRGHLYVFEEEGASPSRALKVPYHGRTVTVELKATGTQVAAPPSPGYSIWHQGPVLRAPTAARVFTDLCDWLHIEAPDLTTAGYPTPWQHEVPVGERNDAQFIEACHLAEAGMPLDEAIEVMRTRFAQAYAKDPVKDRNGDRAMVRTIRSAYQRVAQHRQTGQPPAAAPEATSEPPPPEAVPIGPLLWMSQVEREEVGWLWRPYIPLGKLTLLEGDPGVGKSWVSLALATAVSQGKGPPGLELAAPSRALVLTAEDGIGDTVGPRLDLLGADSSRIAVLRPDVPVTLVDLEMLVIQVRPLLVIVDPLAAFLGREVDMFRSNETRPILAAVAAMAERQHCAVLIVRHITKGAAGRAIYRGQGSIDFTAAARSVLLAGADPEEPTKCALIHIKSNLAARGDPLGYVLNETGFAWAGVSDLTASRILGGVEGSEAPSKLEEAIDFLEQALGIAALPAEQVKADAKALDITDRTLRRAREALGVRAMAIYRQEGKGILRWDWTLPQPPMALAIGGQTHTYGLGHLLNGREGS